MVAEGWARISVGDTWQWPRMRLSQRMAWNFYSELLQTMHPQLPRHHYSFHFTAQEAPAQVSVQPLALSTHVSHSSVSIADKIPCEIQIRCRNMRNYFCHLPSTSRLRLPDFLIFPLNNIFPWVRVIWETQWQWRLLLSLRNESSASRTTHSLHSQLRESCPRLPKIPFSLREALT